MNTTDNGAAADILDLVDRDHLAATLRAGITWLTTSRQPDDAVTQHHGLGHRVADGIIVRFAPTQPQGAPENTAVVSIDAGYYPGAPSPRPRLLTDSDCARFEEAITAAGGHVIDSWNGPGCITGGWAITGISPTLAAAVARYRAGCPIHDTVFCPDRPKPCTWYRDGYARLIQPTFPPAPVAADDLDYRWSFWRALDVSSRGVPFLKRRGVDVKWFGIYWHRLPGPDPGLDLHDHPWSAVILVGGGGYTERSAEARAPGIERERTYRRGQFRRLRATEIHTITAVEPGTWTLVARGPRRAKTPVGPVDKRGAWGFYQPSPEGPYEWVPHTLYNYDARRPCEVARS
jgi:hypothetical protein